jgi:hypothetical protein
MPALGRLVSPDERDQAYPLRSLLPSARAAGTKYWWSNGAWLNQGRTSTCVGHAWAHWIEDGPRTWQGTVDPIALYRTATTLDVWPENDGDLHFGTSIRAGAEAVVQAGRAFEYRWAWDLPTIVQTLLQVGPVVVGTDWFSNMSTPARNYTLDPSGDYEGGHAYDLNGVSTTRRLVRMKNSWGREWGNNGHAYLTFDALDYLISRQGEACLAVEA